MCSEATVERGERLRLFYGLPVPAAGVTVLTPWQENTFDGLPGVRIVPQAFLHVTLAFLGARPRTELDALRSTLHESASGLAQPVLALRRYRETDRVGMLVFDDEHGRAGLLQERLTRRLETLGAFTRERRPWLAHLTVARFRGRPRLRPELPELPPLRPEAAALYESRLGPGGARYEILEAAELSG